MIIHCVFATEYCARCSKHRADQLFGCTRLQFRGVGPIWLIRELPCTNLHVEKIVSKVIIIAFHHLHVSKIPKKRRKNKENILFFPQNRDSDNPGRKSLGIYCNMHISLSFLRSLLKQCIFEIFLHFPLPPPYTKLKLGKNSGYTRPTLFVG